MASPVSTPPPAFVCPCSVCVRRRSEELPPRAGCKVPEASHDPPRSHAGGTKALGNAGAHPVRSGPLPCGADCGVVFLGRFVGRRFCRSGLARERRRTKTPALTGDELARLTQEMAIDACWGYIESASIGQLENGIEWMDVSDELHNHEDEFRCLSPSAWRKCIQSTQPDQEIATL